MIIAPQPGRQTQFLSSSADIVVYGGSAGGGKTWGLLMEPTRHLGNPEFGAVIFRNTFTQIAQEGGMWDESQKIYPYLGGIPNNSRYFWRFPSGARIRFAHLQHEKDKLIYQGAQIALIEWDQLEQFSSTTFFYLLSRNRSTCGIRPYIRATCNPDADSWLVDFLSWWIADDGYANLERAGVIRWFIRIGLDIVWGDTKDELLELDLDALPTSVTFIPSTVFDNPILLEKDPGYLAKLKALLPVDRERLLGDPERGGNWKIRAGAGKVFDRAWFEIVEAVPPGGVACLCWDFAATEKKMRSDDPDYTAAVLIIMVEQRFYVVHAMAVRVAASEVDTIFENLTWQLAKHMQAQGRAFMVRWGIEPGSAGKKVEADYVRLLAGLDAEGFHETGDKIQRAKPFAAQAKIGNVKVLEAEWNEMFLNHLHNQPAKHDDIMDCASGSFNALIGMDMRLINVVPAFMMGGQPKGEAKPIDLTGRMLVGGGRRKQ
jgi:predicted phage terminase large subunit-like protein